MKNRFAPIALILTLTGGALLTGCVIAPPGTHTDHAVEIAKMSDRATATCGAGQVREVNAKSFTCK